MTIKELRMHINNPAIDKYENDDVVVISSNRDIEICIAGVYMDKDAIPPVMELHVDTNVYADRINN